MFVVARLHVLSFHMSRVNEHIHTQKCTHDNIYIAILSHRTYLLLPKNSRKSERATENGAENYRTNGERKINARKLQKIELHVKLT